MPERERIERPEGPSPATLSLLAAKRPDDDTQAQDRKAMVVLKPLFAKYPDNPGVVHYIIHACDNPAMAAEGLAATAGRR